MAFSSLPVDVLDVLCQFIAESDLPAVARVNSRICPSAQRYLYRSLAFTSPAKAARCFKTLRRNPLLHRHVRELSLRADPYAPLLRSLVDLLGAVLADAQNLISLELVLPQCATNVFLAAEKKDTLYARLVNFSCNLPFSSALCSFLQRTPSVKVLQLSDYSSAYSDLPDLPISALPSLQAFTGSSDLATLLAPGRPLESVHLFSGELSQTIIDALSRSSSSIAIFGAFTTSLSPSILHCLAENLPHLHHLRIMTMYHTFNQPDEVSCSL